jgi:hypothetical protein
MNGLLPIRLSFSINSSVIGVDSQTKALIYTLGYYDVQDTSLEMNQLLPICLPFGLLSFFNDFDIRPER